MPVTLEELLSMPVEARTNVVNEILARLRRSEPIPAGLLNVVLAAGALHAEQRATEATTERAKRDFRRTARMMGKFVEESSWRTPSDEGRSSSRRRTGRR